ncbi:Proprotein convertase subtilisin/kexin type 4, partial [Manacus vitellinus]
RHGLLYLGQVMEGEPYYHLGHRGTRQRALSRHWGWHVRLMRDPEVLWFEQQTLKRRTKRGASVVPTDPWFPKQWYMVRWCCFPFQSSPRAQNALPTARPSTQTGLMLAVDPQASYDFNSNDPDPQPRYGDGDNNWHGTRCAGEVAAVASNGICGAGVAYNAKIGGETPLRWDGGLNPTLKSQPRHLYPHILLASSPALSWRDLQHLIIRASKPAHLKAEDWAKNGVGRRVIWASGKGGIHYDDCNCDGYGNSIYTVSVGSVLGDGQRPRYSEGCAAILTTTYSSRASSDVQILTYPPHDLEGLNLTLKSQPRHLCPHILLASSPALSWRDLQHLIIRASKPAHLKAEDWAKNGVGRRVSHYYGYGLLDAGLLVQEAMAWAGTRPQEKCSVKVLQAPRDIGSKLTISTDVFSCSQSISWLEHVQVQLSLSYSRRGDLVVALSSPTGTTSMLVTMRPYDTSQEGYKDWTFMSTHFWDENPKGTWTLHLENKGDAHNTG